MFIPVSERLASQYARLCNAAQQPGVRPRKGFAMFMALGALVIVAVLIAGSSFLTQQESRLGQNQLVQSRAMAAAEFGLNRIQADWDKTPNLTMANGAIFDTLYTLASQGTAMVRYVRLNNETFWIVSEGRATIGSTENVARTAVKRVGAILRLRVPTIKANGAVTTAGKVVVKGSGQIRGANTNPVGWTGCASAPDKAAIVVADASKVDIQKAGNVTGTPQVTIDPLAADSNTYVRFGDETWTALVAGANITVAAGNHQPQPTVVSGSCAKSNTNNWGEPARAETAGNQYAAPLVPECNNYFPIIYASGSVGMKGRGQGILLINGDITFNSGFLWSGLIIVKDDILKGNGHAQVFGGIMARNNEGTAVDAQDFTGTVDMIYSACGLDRAMRGSASVVQAKHRAWTEMY